MNRRAGLLAACALAGGFLGYTMASIPAPSDPGTFWAGNFSSPWAVLAFAAGWSQRRAAWAVASAIAAELACVAGFCARLLFIDPAHQGLPPDTAPMVAALAGLGHWIAFAAPWLAAGIGAGLMCGVLGCWWGRTRSLVPIALISMPFPVEPLVWRVYEGRFRGPAIAWIAEVAVGGAVLGAVAASERRRRGRRAGAG